MADTAPVPPGSTEADDTDQPFRLFDLPAELVLRILKFAVVTSTTKKPLEVRKSGSAVQPAIIRTCRLLRTEGLKLFYAENVFHKEGHTAKMALLWEWLSCIEIENYSQIGFLYIELVDGDEEPWSAEKLYWAVFVNESCFLENEARRASLRNLFAVTNIHFDKSDQRVLLVPDNDNLAYRISLRPQSRLPDPDKWLLLAKIVDARWSSEQRLQTDCWKLEVADTEA